MSNLINHLKGKHPSVSWSFSDDSFEIVEYSSCEDAGNKEFALTGKILSKENLAQSPINHISSPDQVDKTEDVTYSENSKELIQREQGTCGHVLCTCDNTQEQFPHIPVFEPASLQSLASTLPDAEVQDSNACGCNSRLIDGPQSGLILDVNYLTKQKPTCVHCSPDLSSARKFAFSNSSSSVSTSNVSVDNPTNCTSHFTDNASHSTESISHSTGSVSQSTENVSHEPTSESEHLFDSTCRTCTDTDSVRQQSDSCTEHVESTSPERLCQTSSTDCLYSKIDQQESSFDEQGEEDTGKDLKSNIRESENLTSTRRDICLPLRLDIPKKNSPYEEQSNEKANGDSSEDQSVFVTDSLPTPVCRRGKPLLTEDLDKLLDKDGRLVDEHALRKAVFMGGVDPNVRKQVWQFLFGLYPCSSTTREREEFLLDYIMKYHEQMSRWKTILMLNAKPGASLLQQGLVARYQIEDSNNELRSPEDILEDPISEFEMLERNLMAGKNRSGKPDFNALSKNFHTIDISSPEMQQKMDFMKIQSQVYVNRQKLDIKSLWSHIRVIDKDVPRTDRDLDYFRGAMNPSLTVLRNILITFAAFNSDIGYAQGMNDILAQFLVVFDSEVEAYWCFSNYMKKIQREFTEDGMVNKISLVALLLQEMDPALYEHLKANDLGDLLFCHRWLLLGFKREFKFMDSLRCFEILSSHHLELTSLEADKARRHELKKEFEHLRGVQRSTAPSDTEAEYTFELFMCIALLQKARCELMECTDTAMVFSIINQLEINLDDILLKSAELFYFYCKKTVEDSFLLVDSPQPQGSKSNTKRLQ